MREAGAPTPYPTGLIDLLKPRMSPKLVRFIALSDDGEDNYPAQRDAINRIIQLPRIPVPLNWEPREAFSLIKWSEPDHGSDTKHLSVREQHLCRMFCCACLLAVFDKDEWHDSELSDVLPRLIESTVVTKIAWIDDLQSLIDWASDRCDQLDDDRDKCEADKSLCRVASVILAAASTKPEDTNVARVVEEIFEHKQRSFVRGSDRWTWFLEDSYFNQSIHIWRSLVTKYLSKPPAAWARESRQACEHLAHAILQNHCNPDGQIS